MPSGCEPLLSSLKWELRGVVHIDSPGSQCSLLDWLSNHVLLSALPYQFYWQHSLVTMSPTPGFLSELCSIKHMPWVMKQPWTRFQDSKKSCKCDWAAGDLSRLKEGPEWVGRPSPWMMWHIMLAVCPLLWLIWTSFAVLQFVQLQALKTIRQNRAIQGWPIALPGPTWPYLALLLQSWFLVQGWSWKVSLKNKLST